MRRNILVKLGIILFFVILFLYLLYPTIKFNYLMNADDKAALELEDPEEYERLLENSIKLGLDLQGGMHVVMEVDIEELSRALAKNKDERFEEAWQEARNVSTEGDADFLTALMLKLEEKGADPARYYGTKSMRERDEILSYLSRRATAGQEVELTIIRDGQTQTVTLILGERPSVTELR